MTIQVLLFGACREAAGTGEFSLEFSPPLDVSRVFAEVARLFPALSPFEKSALFAINEEHVRGDHRVFEGDTLAIFPPVSGGV